MFLLYYYYLNVSFTVAPSTGYLQYSCDGILMAATAVETFR